jgi:hypothetical protein
MKGGIDEPLEFNIAHLEEGESRSAKRNDSV